MAKKVLNVKLKGKCVGRRLRSRWQQEDRKDDTQKEGGAQEDRDTAEEAWLLHDPHKVQVMHCMRKCSGYKLGRG
jgi:hypothetical protein